MYKLAEYPYFFNLKLRSKTNNLERSPYPQNAI
jgi:hypothetical protein